MNTYVEPGYLLFLGDVSNPLDAKTAFGLQQWCPEKCIGQWRSTESTVDLGLFDMNFEKALEAGARTLVIGVAPSGGKLPESWIHLLQRALASGLNIASGLHDRLVHQPALVETAAQFNRRLIDVRHHMQPPCVANGLPRSGKRLLTVGTDCASGKKYTALAIEREMTRRGIRASFRATGQTGILIAGSGIPLDAIVADFAAGAVEELAHANDEDHWDIIEGQGSLFHPAYAGVSLALLHGAQPDALVLCHQPGRASIDGFEHFPMPDLAECIRRNEQAAHLTNPKARCVGISLDTSRLEERDRTRELGSIEKATGLPVVDPIITGVSSLVEALADTRDSAGVSFSAVDQYAR